MLNLSNQTFFALLAITLIFITANLATHPAYVLVGSAILIVTGFAGYISMRILMFVKVTLSVHRTKKVPHPTANIRTSNAQQATAVRKHGVTGQQLMEIPAYARKAKGVCYPMNLQVLNGSRYTVHTQR